MMEQVEELDVVRLKNGNEVTVLEVFPTEPKYYCQDMDDEMFFVTSDEIAEITYQVRRSQPLEENDAK